MITRPQDLLHAVGFDLSLIESCNHPNIIGVQVTMEDSSYRGGGGLFAHVRIANLDMSNLRRFKFDGNSWSAA